MLFQKRVSWRTAIVQKFILFGSLGKLIMTRS